jgi:hypothetical protein
MFAVSHGISPRHLNNSQVDFSTAAAKALNVFWNMMVAEIQLLATPQLYCFYSAIKLCCTDLMQTRSCLGMRRDKRQRLRINLQE